MRAIILRHAVIGAVTLVGLLIIGASAWILYPLRATVAEDMLPADRVAAFLRLTTDADRDALRPWFGLIDDLPAMPPGTAAALLTLDDGSAAWVLLPPPATPRDKPVPQASDQRVLALVHAKQDAPLRTALPYARLAVLARPLASRAFLQPNLLQAVFPLPAWMDAHIPLLVEAEGKETRLIKTTEPLPPADPLPAARPLAFADPFLVLSAADAPALFTRMMPLLSEEQREAALGRLTAELRGLIGEDLSLAHDLRPLVAGRSTLHMAAGSGRNLLMLEGSLTDRARTEERLQKLHRLFASSLPQSIVLDRQLDENFSERTVALADPSPQMHTETIEGWTVHFSRQGAAGRELATAVGGSHFLIGNSIDALRATLGETHGRLTLPLPEGGSPVAGGFLGASVLNNASLRPFLPGTLPPLPAPMLWSAAQFGDRLVVTMRRE